MRQPPDLNRSRAGWRRGGLGASLLLLVGVGLSSADSIAKLVYSHRQLERTYQVLRQIDRVDGAIKDSELGRRGYLINQDEDFLRVFRSSLQTASVTLNELQALTADDQAQQQRIQAVRGLIQQHFSDLRQSVGIHRSAPRELQTQTALTRQGEQVQVKIQLLLSEMTNAEQLLLQQRAETGDLSLQTTRLINWLGYGLSFGLLTLIFYLLEQEIQQRRATEQASLLLLAETTDLYNNAPCGYHSLDRNGRFVQINDTELKWLGYERSELLGQPFVQLLSPESQTVFQTQFSEFVTQGQLKNLELLISRKDGSTLPVSLSATAVRSQSGFIMSRASLFDLSDLKQAEAALRLSEATFRSLSEFAPIGIFMTNAAGQIIYSNMQAQKICGYSQSESLGYGWTQLVHPDDLHRIIEQWQDHTRQTSTHQTSATDLRYLHRDGTVRYGCVRTAPILDAQAVRVAYVGTIEDITESRAIAQMKSEFVSIVSHELRTPLTAIRGSLGLLAGGIYDQKPEKGRRMVQVAAEQTDRLVRLINDILDFQRLESGKIMLEMQCCDAESLVLQSVEAMRPCAEEQQIGLCMNVSPLPIWAHPDSILQTLTNLISNAVKFSSAGRTICISVELMSQATDALASRNAPQASLQRSGPLRPLCGCDAAPPAGEPREPRASHASNARSNPPPADLPADYALFSIQDEGRGIPAELLEKVFEQFQQVDASDSRLKGGTGLGLAICRKIVEQHGGQIWVESLLGQGSIFYFTVPLFGASRPTEAASSPALGALGKLDAINAANAANA